MIQEQVEVIPLREMFRAYCKMDPVSNRMNVELLPLSQSNNWLVSAQILDMNKLTTTDTGILFFKFRKRAIAYKEYLTYLQDLAKTKDLDLEEMKYKMQRSGAPLALTGKQNVSSF